MQAIRVRYKPATNSRGASLHVTNGHKSLRVPYDYGNDDHMKFEAAKAFVQKYMQYAPELYPIPCEFKGDSFYSFIPNNSSKKLDEIMQQIIQVGQNTGNIISKNELSEILRKYI